jgi:hypothetical protein
MDSGSEYWFAVIVYLVGSVIALLLWRQVVRALPHPIGGISWLILFSILFSPTVTEGDNGRIAPAVFGLLFGVISEQKALMMSNLLPILLVLGLGLLVGFLIQCLRIQRR